MAIVGIDAVIFGVDSLEEGRRFFEDWGLARARSGKGAVVMEAQDGAQVILKPRDAKDLPKAIERGNTVREVVWGVGSPRDLARIKAELSRDRAVTVDRDGTLHSFDDMGLGIAFRRSRKRKVKKPGRTPINAPHAPARIDARATYYDRARPLTLGHCVFMCPDYRKMERFYTRRLGFRVSDYYTGRGVFLRASARGGHHNLFFLEDENGATALNHVAFGVRDVHEVFAGGLYITGKGWETAIGPGRHHVSSCYFWYFRNPSGGNIEYFTDEDFLTEKWKPGHWNPKPETFAEWVLAKGLPRARALPPTRTKQDAAKR